MSVVDKLLTGTYTALIGIGIVFLMLFILVGILTVMAKIGDGSVKRYLLKFKKKPDEIAAGKEVKALDAPKASDSVDNAKLVAAITAAIAAYTAENGEAPKAEFFVKSIRKI